ncbi:MAG: peptide deformylase [Pseudomonadota bacterium]
MAILDILTYPEKSLLIPSVTVETIDNEIKQLIQNMGQTMFNAPGVGLAAPQVGVNKRIIVYDSNADNPDFEGEKTDFTALINPQIIEASGSIISEGEGCLSVVDYNADVNRYEKVTVTAQDIDGNDIQFDAKGILAVIMQHEIDHLDGILFIDRISILKRAMYKKKIKKMLE